LHPVYVWPPGDSSCPCTYGKLDGLNKGHFTTFTCPLFLLASTGHHPAFHSPWLHWTKIHKYMNTHSPYLKAENGDNVYLAPSATQPAYKRFKQPRAEWT
jgi:hypothetical protein